MDGGLALSDLDLCGETGDGVGVVVEFKVGLAVDFDFLGRDWLGTSYLSLFWTGSVCCGELDDLFGATVEAEVEVRVVPDLELLGRSWLGTVNPSLFLRGSVCGAELDDLDGAEFRAEAEVGVVVDSEFLSLGRD